MRVVVLDDEEPVGQAVARMLREGYQVTTLTTPSALFARLMAGERWDVVLCDVMLPEIDGSVVHERVAAIDPELARHTVFISGGVLDPRVEARLAALPNALLLKPFTPQQLRAAVRAAAESRTAPRA